MEELSATKVVQYSIETALSTHVVCSLCTRAPLHLITLRVLLSSDAWGMHATLTHKLHYFLAAVKFPTGKCGRYIEYEHQIFLEKIVNSSSKISRRQNFLWHRPAEKGVFECCGCPPGFLHVTYLPKVPQVIFIVKPRDAVYTYSTTVQHPLLYELLVNNL